MKYLKKLFYANAFQIIIVSGGLVVTLVNMYIATLLAPLASNISTVARRVDAVEEELENRASLVERFIVVETQTKQIHEEVIEIKQDIKLLLQR